MIAVIDYGAGNIFSIKNALDYLGENAVLTAEEKVISSANKIILPGVGAFPDAMDKLKEKALDYVIKSEALKKPLLGICLGMQLLFSESHEFEPTEGLGLIEGKVDKIKTSEKIPHMGWNSLDFCGERSPIFKYINNGDFVYFVHSYYGSGCKSSTIATASYGVPLTAAVSCGNVFGCQFHPEKSGKVGLAILKAFCEIGG